MLEDVGEINEILGRSYGMPGIIIIIILSLLLLLLLLYLIIIDGIEEDDLDAELACL